MARILVMEDDVAVGFDLAEQLRKAGHDVAVRRSATDAREELWYWDYELLITDIVVKRHGRPVADGGLALISWVRHTETVTPHLKKLPIIAITGEQQRRGMDFLLPTAARIGANAEFQKPADTQELLETITSLLGAADN